MFTNNYFIICNWYKLAAQYVLIDFLEFLGFILFTYQMVKVTFSKLFGKKVRVWKTYCYFSIRIFEMWLLILHITRSYQMYFICVTVDAFRYCSKTITGKFFHDTLAYTYKYRGVSAPLILHHTTSRNAINLRHFHIKRQLKFEIFACIDPLPFRPPPPFKFSAFSSGSNAHTHTHAGAQPAFV